MKSLLTLAQVAFLALLVSCGGGGGSPGAVSTGGVSGTTPPSSTTVTATADGTISVELLNGSGQPTQSISAIEIAAIKVTVKDAKGVVVPGTIVTFSESGVGLLKFSPDAKTALTTSEGIASLEVRAADQTRTGATTISVGATVAKTIITASKVLEVTNAPVTIGVPVDPQTLATAINFVSTDPADKAIVLKGAGGNGRTETGVLTFRVVDKNSTPVKGVTVDFVVNPSTDVVLNIVQGKTDADGVVITSISSKLVPTAVVVKATVSGRTVTTQSDQLKVTTGLGISAGFEILPLVYNLDGALSGDSTPVTARLVDVNSNPVADGVPVVMVATGGKIGSSAAGGCNTVNGACTVTFEVQNPRPASGIVDISGSAKVGETTTLLSQIKVHMSSAPLGIFEPADGIPAATLTAPRPLSLIDCSKAGRTYMVANALGYSVPSGSTVSTEKDSTELGASVIGAGNTVLDSSSFAPSFFGLSIDPSAATSPPCVEDGIDFATGVVGLVVEAPKSKRKSRTPLAVTYPAGKLELIGDGTGSDPVVIKLEACAFEKVPMQAIALPRTLSLPAGSTFVASTSETSAKAVISTVDPDNLDPSLAKNLSKSLAVASSASARQTIWLLLKAPTGGVSPCDAATPRAEATFTVSITITSTNGRINTKTITASYPKKGA